MLGWPKSSFGFSRGQLGRTRMNFLVNPIYPVTTHFAFHTVKLSLIVTHLGFNMFSCVKNQWFSVIWGETFFWECYESSPIRKHFFVYPQKFANNFKGFSDHRIPHKDLLGVHGPCIWNSRTHIVERAFILGGFLILIAIARFLFDFKLTYMTNCLLEERRDHGKK